MEEAVVVWREKPTHGPVYTMPPAACVLCMLCLYGCAGIVHTHAGTRAGTHAAGMPLWAGHPIPQKKKNCVLPLVGVPLVCSVAC